MKKLLHAAALALAMLAAVSPASAQQAIGYQAQVGNVTKVIPVTAANPLPVNATVTASATITALAPTGNAVLALTTSSARVAFASADGTALITNTGSVVAYIKFGTVAVTATTTDTPIQAGQSIAFAVGSNAYVAGITASSTSNLTITTGTGLPAIAGGGSSGGGGAVTCGGSACATAAKQPALGTAGSASTDVITIQGIASGTPLPVSAAASSHVDGWDLTQGAKADGVCGTSTGTCSIAALIKYLNTQAAIIATAAADTTTPTPVKIDQTTPGTTNHVDAGLSAATTGGCTPYGLQSAASTNSTNVKASAGTLCSLSLVNTTATLYYLRLYNASSAPTCSSATNFVLTVPVPASATGAGVVVNAGSFGWAFSTGISFCLTGGGASTDNTNAATGVYLAASYK